MARLAGDTTVFPALKYFCENISLACIDGREAVCH